MRVMRVLGVLLALAAMSGIAARRLSRQDRSASSSPITPGGFNDTLGRIVAQKFTDDWGVPAVVENRPGGGTLIGTDAVAKAPRRRLHAAGRRVPVRREPEPLRQAPLRHA